MTDRTGAVGGDALSPPHLDETMTGFLRDLHFALRSLRNSPWLALTAVVAMALGIGLTTTIYGVIDAAMLRGLPLPGGDRIVSVMRAEQGGGPLQSGLAARDFFALRSRQRSLEGLAAFDERPMNLSGDERPERVTGSRVTGDAFTLLRAQPALGRAITAADDAPGAPVAAVISDALWRSRFAADPRVVGRVIRIDGEPATVVGVMRAGFRFPVTTDLWVAARLDPARYVAEAGEMLEVFGRLRPDAEAAAAGRELSTIRAALAADRPAAERDVRLETPPYVDAFMGGENSAQLWTMLAAVVLVLVIACVNVANLLLARAATRMREISVRAALGASRRRVVALFLTESLALAVVGALGGLAVAWAGMRVFTAAVADTQPPFWIVLRMDARVLAFVVAATVVAALVAGCLPALHAARATIGDVLKDGTRGTSGFRVGRVSRALVIVELALSGGLLVATGLMVTTIDRLRTRDFGVDAHGTFAARLMLPARLGDDSATARFADGLLARLREAGVQRVALATALPVADGSPVLPVRIDGVRRDVPNDPLARRIAVSPGYFDAVGARSPSGRDFDARDRLGAPAVALVNAAFARRHFGTESAVGRRVEMRVGEAWRPATIVGVAPDVAPGGTSEEATQEAVYVPLAQWPARFLAVAARSEARGGDPLALAHAVRTAVAAADPDLAVSNVGTLAAWIQTRTWFYRVFGGAFTIFGLTALFLAALGLYAVMAASVARRTRELGVRMALGADTRGIVRLVMRQSAIQIAVGGALGLALGFGLSQLLRGLLFGVKPGDPTVTLGVVAVLAATGALASAVPALRATRVDPMRALRVE